MRALRFHGREDLRLEDVPEPEPGPGEVLVRPAHTGVCGTDLHVYFTPEASGFDFGAPHPVTGATLPQIFGHEFSGTVTGVGEGVADRAVGDRVAVWPLVSCGTCTACAAGLPHGCLRLACQGISSPGGGMSAATVVPAARTFLLPEAVDLRLGALVEPMATSWHAVRRSGIRPGESALVAGAGPIGIGLWFALRAHGVDDVVVSEPIAGRRDALSALGASVVAPDDVPGAVGDGVDVAFEAAGSGAAVEACLAALRPQSRLVIVALHEAAFPFNPTPMVFAEHTVIGSIAYEAIDFTEVIDAMAGGTYDTRGWVEDVEFEDVDATLRALRSGERMKVLVRS